MSARQYSTSPDPISLIAEESPRSAGNTAPALRSINHNRRSSRKEVTLQPLDADGNSPWKIKLTIEADAMSSPHTGVSRRPGQSREAIKVPVKGLDSSPAVARVENSTVTTRPRRTTPARQAQVPSGDRLATSNLSDATQSVPRRRTQRVASTPLLRAASRPDPPNAQSTQSRADLFHLSKPAPVQSVIAPEPDLHAPGDVTTMESEEFSMISVDSLSSRHAVSEKNVDNSQADISRASFRGSGKNDMTWSYMPSSPPVYHTDSATPQIAQTPQQPPKNIQPTFNIPTVTTPQRASVVRSGKVLQDIVRTPVQTGLRTRHGALATELFAGFSSNARRDLHRSLQVGLNMASTQQQAPLPTTEPEHQHITKSDNYPTITVPQADHRLPTPDDMEDKSLSMVSNGPAVYPDLTEALIQPPSHISARSYDMMSWMPTGPERRSSPLARDRSAVHVPNSSPAAAVVNISSEDEEAEDGEEEEDDSHDDSQEGMMDLWQEEAVRSDHVEHSRNVAHAVSTASSHVEEPIERSTAASSATDDMPADAENDIEEDDVSVTSASSSDQQSHLTPDEDEDASSGHNSDMPSADGDDTGLFWQRNMPNVYRRRERFAPVSFISDVRAPTSDAPEADSSVVKSKISDKSTAFTASRQTSVLSSPLRKSMLRSSRLLSSPEQEKETTLGRTTSVIDASNSQTFDATEHTEQSNRTLHMSDASYPQTVDATEHTDQESTAADVRQLRSEMARHEAQPTRSEQDHDEETGDFSDEADEDVDHSDAESFASVEESQFGQSLLESTDLHVSRSYVENLNLDSPAKIRVKFNDSSVQGQQNHSSLLRGTPRATINVTELSPAKKKYGSLFEADAPLGAQDMSASASVLSETTPRQQFKLASSPSQSLFSQMTSSLWSAVTPKSAPNPKPTILLEQSSPSIDVTPRAPKVSGVPDLTLRLRRKYGILEASHPFTRCHAHTLRRLYMSTVQHPDQTLVPLDTKLTPEEKAMRHLPCRPDDDYIHIVSSFMALLVPQADKQSGQWGDASAAKLRGWDSRGRHGSWFAFDGDSKEDKDLRALKGEIKADWIMEVLKHIVYDYLDDVKEGRRSVKVSSAA